jgi:hypothetical protein
LLPPASLILLEYKLKLQCKQLTNELSTN